MAAMQVRFLHRYLKGGENMVMTDAVVRKFDEAFMMGLSDRQACVYVGIPYSTFTTWLERNESYRTKKEELKENPKIWTKLNIVKALKEGDLETSKWYAERKMKDEGFNTRQELETKNTNENVNKNIDLTHLSTEEIKELLKYDD